MNDFFVNLANSRDLSVFEKSKLLDYIKWFHGSFLDNLDVLIELVKSSQGYGDWNANFSADSLDELGCWFQDHINTRDRTIKEMNDLEGIAAFPLPTWELTNETNTYIFLVAVYFSKVVFENRRNLKWGSRLKNKRDFDYGQPLIEGFGSQAMNPMHIVRTLAYGIANKNKTGEDLRRLYDYWICLK